MNNQIFISYRRDTGRDIARNITDRLTTKGYSVFFDYTSLRNGRFNEQIFTAIQNSDDFILVLSKDALDRCCNTEDWVRLEIICALKNNKNIILVQDEKFIEFPAFFPEELSAIKNIDFTPINQKYYDGFIDLLLTRLTAKLYPKIALNDNNIDLNTKALNAYRFGTYSCIYIYSLLSNYMDGVKDAYKGLCQTASCGIFDNIFPDPETFDIGTVESQNLCMKIEGYFTSYRQNVNQELGAIAEFGYCLNIMATLAASRHSDFNKDVRPPLLTMHSRCEDLAIAANYALKEFDNFLTPKCSNEISSMMAHFSNYYKSYMEHIVLCRNCHNRCEKNSRTCRFCGNKLQ